MYTKCKKCGGTLKQSKALKQTYKISTDFIGDCPGQGCTVSFGGPGELQDCLKCEDCGWSMTIPTITREALIKKLCDLVEEDLKSGNLPKQLKRKKCQD